MRCGLAGLASVAAAGALWGLRAAPGGGELWSSCATPLGALTTLAGLCAGAFECAFWVWVVLVAVGVRGPVRWYLPVRCCPCTTELSRHTVQLIVNDAVSHWLPHAIHQV